MNSSSNKESLIIGSESLNERVWSLTAEDQSHRHSEMLILLHQTNAQIKAAELRLAEQDKKIQELESLASTDVVTGLMNRRGFENFFLQELGRTRRHNTFGSVLVLFDLDKFKEINDTYGHQAGDACLKGIAAFLQKNIRNVDAAARIGGDEFAVLLSHTDTEKSANWLSEVKSVLEGGLKIVWQETTLRICASVGIKHVSDTSSFETAYHGADKDLYNNKRQRKLAQSIKITNLGNTVNATGLDRDENGALMEGSVTPTLTQLMLNAL